MTSRPDSITLVPGHEITSVGIRKKRAILDMLSMECVLDRVGNETNIGALNRPLGTDFFGSVHTYELYSKAMSDKDWGVSDSLVFTALASNTAVRLKLLEAEEWSRAFNGWLCWAASMMPFAYRWIDPEELESLKSGAFLNKAKNGLAQRTHKAFSLNPNLKFLARKVMVAVPLTTSMRDSIHCVCYTALPRDIMEEAEKIADPKSIRHANEAEIRVPDGTAIPHGTTIIVQKGIKIDQRVLSDLEKWCTIMS